MSETDELALRFIKVMEGLNHVSRPRMPHDVVGQLRLNQLAMLHCVYHEPGVAQKDLAERFQITPAAISTAIRDMETIGLVERIPDPADARQMCIHLSPRGKELVTQAQAMRREAVARLLSALPLPEQYTIIDALERALAATQNPKTSS